MTDIEVGEEPKRDGFEWVCTNPKANDLWENRTYYYMIQHLVSRESGRSLCGLMRPVRGARAWRGDYFSREFCDRCLAALSPNSSEAPEAP